MKVLILSPFANFGLHLLREQGWEVVYEPWDKSDTLQDPEALGQRLHQEGFTALVVEADFLFRETFEVAPRLRFAGVCRSSVASVDVEAATELGVVVVNAPGRNAEAVAELALGLMFAVARRIVEADRFIRSGDWVSPTHAYKEMRGVGLAKSSLGIVGLGRIGKALANMCSGLQMRLLGHDPQVTHEEAAAFGIELMPLDNLLAAADIISLHASAEAGVILTKERFNIIKRGAIVINTSAYELLEEEALLDALHVGNVAAGLDVFDSHPIDPNSPLLRLNNVVLTPHIGGATPQVVEQHTRMLCSNLVDFGKGKRPLNLVNPEVWD